MINKYDKLFIANCDAFLEDIEYKEKLRVLTKLYSAFEQENVKWALSCSANLFFKGIVDDFNDYDIFIANESKEDFLKVMKKLGAVPKDRGDQSCFDSDMFLCYSLDGINLDFVAAYTVVTFGTRYRYEYTESELEFAKVGEWNIPLIPMEAQYLLYGMMEGWQPKRIHKRTLIENYLKSQKSNNLHPQIFKKAMEEYNLPSWLKRKIRELK